MSIILIVILQNLNPSHSTLGKPYDSTLGFSNEELLIIFLIIVVVALYIGLQVWKSLKNERMNKK